MVGFSRAVVSALVAAASVTALPQRGGNGHGGGRPNNGNGNGNGNGGGNTALPTVDLGYAVHQAVSGNVRHSHSLLLNWRACI